MGWRFTVHGQERGKEVWTEVRTKVKTFDWVGDGPFNCDGFTRLRGMQWPKRQESIQSWKNSLNNTAP